jgi:glycosyltransferase involved in cell wall biosynthesis
MIRFSLVIPCYNEARNLPLVVARCREAFTRPDIEVVLVDNGSTDDTPSVLSALLAQKGPVRHIRVAQNEGYGHGILMGLQAARGAILGWTHADMQTDPSDALLGLALFDAAAQPDTLFVKGAREGRPFSDEFFTIGMSVFETMLLRHRFWDVNAQPTMFSRAFFESWKNPPKDFALDLYAYYTARHAGLAIARFPVRFPERAHGVSHWNATLRGKMKFIRRTISFSLQLRRSLERG